MSIFDLKKWLCSRTRVGDLEKQVGDNVDEIKCLKVTFQTLKKKQHKLHSKKNTYSEDKTHIFVEKNETLKFFAHF